MGGNTQLLRVHYRDLGAGRRGKKNKTEMIKKMLKKDGNRIVKNIIVTREQDAQIKEIGRQIGISDSAVIRLAVSQWLSERTQKTCEKS